MTIRLGQTERAKWVWFVTGIPTVLMYVMSTWALARFVRDGFIDSATGNWRMTSNPVPWLAIVLIVLALTLLIEAMVVFVKPAPAAPINTHQEPAAA